jgi:hypothetical protein
MLYQQNAYPSSNGALSVPLPTHNHFYKPLVLPPMRTYDQFHVPVHSMPQHLVHHDAQGHYGQHQHEVKEEKPIGGVSAKLDYDMDFMTDFVSETAHAMYALFSSPSICLADIDIAGSILPNKPIPPTFRKWVSQVLSATRLPSSTILLSFDYLSIRMRMIQHTRKAVFGEPELYQMLTASLILGSKFLDDNTFINRSWAEVSGIPVKTLNQMERDWLDDISFRLHRDPQEPHGFQSFMARWKHFEAEKRSAREGSRRPSPIDTGVQHQHSAHPMYTPTPHSSYHQPSPPPAYSAKSYQAAYPTPSYTRFDPFVISRSSDTSPASAPHTGPTTPEYYGPPGTWGSINGNCGYSTRLHGSASSFAPRPQQTQSLPPPPPQVPQLPFLSLGYPPPPVYASDHGRDCCCNSCNRQYMMAPGFGVPQPVMA